MPNPARPARPRQRNHPQTPLATILDAQGRRLVWVAQHLGVDSSTVSRWRSGDRPIPARRREQLAALLAVNADDLQDARPVGEEVIA